LAANHYIKYRHYNGDCRFDIVSVIGQNGQLEEIEHIEEAF
jgi:Holliday junction resolvase-like predicted endonuclease